MATTASRLAKIESRISLCDDCAKHKKQDEIFRASLLAQGVELVRERAANTGLERCETCGQQWRYFTGDEDDWSRAEEAVLLEIGEQNKKAERAPSREEWERYFGFHAEMSRRQRVRYGAEAFDKAYAEAGLGDIWKRMEAQAANAPTNAERETNKTNT